MDLTLYAVILLAAGLVAADQEEVEGGKCERIRLPLCQDLGYNWTAMPNLMGHSDQKEAEEEMSSFEAVMSSGCSMQVRFLLCSTFAPLCSEQVSGVVSACRALCDSVAADCAEQLAQHNVSLPCAALPLRADRRLCMRPPNASEPEPAAPPPRWPFHDSEPRDRCPPAHRRTPAGQCWPACGLDARYSAADKAGAQAWTASLAWLSLLSTSFALLTFCVDPARYRYPERPVVWAAACHAVVALAYVARTWLGAAAVSCAGDTLAVDGLAAPGCVAFFALTYYFTLAADAWFLGACAAWYLTAASEWSTEALERAAAYVHAAAWGWAGAWTAAALALRRVAADELTGTCGVADAAAGALVGVPRAAVLLGGAALGVSAAPAVLRVRRALDAGGARRVGRLAARAAAAGLLYWVLAALSTAARLLEARARGGTVELAAVLEAGGAGAGGAWGAVSGCLVLAGGAGAGAWAWSRKSATVCRRALCPPRKAPTSISPPLLRPPAPHPYYKRPLHVSRV